MIPHPISQADSPEQAAKNELYLRLVEAMNLAERAECELATERHNEAKSDTGGYEELEEGNEDSNYGPANYEHCMIEAKYRQMHIELKEYLLGIERPRRKKPEPRVSKQNSLY